MSFNLFVIRLIDSPHRVSKREFWDSTVDGRENRSFVSQSMFFPTLRDEVGLLRKRKEKVVALNFARSIDWILKLIGEKLDFTKDVKDRRESWLNSFRNTLSRISFIDRPTATRYIIPTPIKRIDRRPSITTTTTLPLERISRVHAEINETRERAREGGGGWCANARNRRRVLIFPRVFGVGRQCYELTARAKGFAMGGKAWKAKRSSREREYFWGADT